MHAEFPADLAAHLRDSIRTMRRRYRKRLVQCQEKFSETSVHDLRIETRRMLALMDLLRALHFEDSLRKTRRIYKRRLDAFDELRDTQVQLVLLKPLRTDFPEARDFDLVLRRREKRLIGELRREIKRMKQVRLERRLKVLEKRFREYTGAKSPKRTKQLASAALREAYQDVEGLRQRIRRSRTETIHRTRVAFKRFRYVSELMRPLFPKLKVTQLRRMQAYQGLMGDIQDMEVLIAAVNQAVQLALLPAQNVRHLLKELRRRRIKLIDAFMVAADRLLEFHPDKFT